ncbi:MAG: GNAT family N-acetyltransferase [Alphaproteobacteria bacterium]|nr:GNAT family N-acetyltransferase [Alphaproteobacteria bacterium]
MNIYFEKATLSHKDLIFEWLEKSHIKEFWDNSSEHREDIKNFLESRKNFSKSFGSIFTYWIGSIEDEPYCLLMTSEVTPAPELPKEWNPYLSKTGKTFSIGFMIGEENFLGKGLASPTLRAFTRFIRYYVDPSVDTYIIDPADTNPRAKHVYEKAGFETVTEFMRESDFFKDIKHFLMIKRLHHKNYIIHSFVQINMNPIVEILNNVGWAPQYVEGQKRSIEKLILDEEGDVFVAKHDDHVLGFIQVQHHQWNRLSYIHGLVVSPDHRQQGIAATLLTHVEQVARDRGNRGVFVDTPGDNYGGRAFYKAQAYAEAYIMPDFYEEGLDGVSYLKLFKQENRKALPSAVIRPVTTADIISMVSLSDQKRRIYEKAQPQFWHRAEKANETQSQWFKELLSQEDHILLIAEANRQILGFIIGELKRAPEVYDPGGLTLMIDDFCVKDQELWATIGKKLLLDLQQQAKQRGAIQILIVCGHHDVSKRQFLKKENFILTAEWYVKEMGTLINRKI